MPFIAVEKFAFLIIATVIEINTRIAVGSKYLAAAVIVNSAGNLRDLYLKKKKEC